MRDNKNVTATGSLGFAEVLALIFIVLKLVHVIDWPWIWVLSPIWIGLGVLGILFLIVYITVKTRE